MRHADRLLLLLLLAAQAGGCSLGFTVGNSPEAPNNCPITQAGRC